MDFLKSGYGKTIYKYRAIDKYTLESLIHHELYFSSPKKFNDPHDCHIPIKSDISKDGFIKHYMKLGNDKTIITEAIKNHEGGYEEFLQKWCEDINVGKIAKVCCFSKKNNIIPMWAYYADSFRGICLGFDPKKDLDLFIPPVVVNYPEDNQFPNTDFFQNDISLDLIYTKSNHWRHEEEVRVVKLNNPNNLYKYKPESLTEIVFGYSTPKKDIDTIMQITKSLSINYKILSKSNGTFEYTVIDYHENR